MNPINQSTKRIALFAVGTLAGSQYVFATQC